jgi:hypothetical protein
MPVGYLHLFIRKIADAGIASFFREIRVIGEENVPLDGPVVLYEHLTLHTRVMLTVLPLPSGVALTTT